MRRDGKHAPSAHWPSSPCKSRSLAPHPSLTVLARSAATCSRGASVRSRMTCQRIAGSESNSQSTTVTVFAELKSAVLLLDSSSRLAEFLFFLSQALLLCLSRPWRLSDLWSLGASATHYRFALTGVTISSGWLNPGR